MSRTAGPLRTRTSRRVTRLGHLRACLPAAAVTALLALLVGALLGRSDAGLGAAGGVLVAAAVFAFGALCVDLADRLATSLVLPVGLATYVVTVVVLGTAVVRLDRSTSGPLDGFPWGVVAGVAAWIGTQSWWAWTSPTPYVDLSSER